MGNEKAAYFAQYLGGKINTSLSGTVLDGNWIQRILDDETDFSLLLTPLSAITDEDAIEVAKTYGLDYKNYKPEAKEKIVNLTSNYAPITDFLRSKGYATPFRNHSVEQLIELGWLTLRKDNG